MRRSYKRNRLRRRIINKAALLRLGILFVVLVLLSFWAWGTLFRMPLQSYAGSLSPLNPSEIMLQERLQQDVQKLSTDIGSRNYSRYEQLNSAKTFLEESWTQSGYTVDVQDYKIEGETYYNLEVEKLGTQNPDEIIVVGGHYDSAFNSPGANDNATGVAATLELAKILRDQPTHKTIRFVEFTNEEPPFFWSENMGSLVYAKHLAQNGEKVVAMISLETMGYFSEVTGSQRYPFPVNLFYPSQGDFIAFIGNLRSGGLVRDAISSFRQHVQFPSEGVALPAWIPEIGWSDQWSFWQQGIPGIMITDTAPFRYPYYHTEQDTPDKIDFEKLARVVSGLSRVISDLAA